MAQYRVCISRTSVETTEVVVDAENEKDAEQQALHEVTTHPSDVKWEAARFKKYNPTDYTVDYVDEE